MKKFVHLCIILFFVMEITAQSVGDVGLFDYWEFYSDVENAMYKTSCSHAFEQLNERQFVISQLQSKKDYLNRQNTVKEKLVQLIGSFPKKAPLNARITGVLERKDYSVEKLVYESVPGYYVTAALFLPKNRKGKLPAIIYASGHTENGFRSETYQHIIINLVKKGFVVLAFDPVGQGERLQYFDKKEGKSHFEPTIEHSYPGAQCYISGYSPTNYFVWDGIRTVDYLLTRKEVDPKRIGMTGRSGGGTQTAFTAAFDERILAAAPECFITSMEYILKTIGPQDAEQNLVHMINEGIDHADLLEVRAPKPTLMLTTTRDFFSIQGARDTYKEVKRFYEGLGDGSLISMVEDDDVHISTKKNREAMYAFFQNHLNNPGSSDDLDVEVLEEKELWTTKTGQLATSLKGETLFSLNKKVVEAQVVKLKVSRADPMHIKTVVASAKHISGFEYPKNFGKSLFSGRFVEKEYVLEKYLIPGSGDYMLPVVLFTPVKNKKNEVVLILDELGMENGIKKDSLVHPILQQGYSVLVYDVAGIGSLGPGYLKGDAYIGNTSYNQWFAGILTNKSTVALRTEDILRVVHFIKTDIGNYKTISALASGTIGSELLHAATFDETIQKICLVRPFLSFADIALTEKYLPAFIPSTVAGAITEYDLADLMAALYPRKISIINPLSSDGSPLSKIKTSDLLVYPEKVYSNLGAEGNFKYSIEKEDEPIYKRVYEWLNKVY